MAVVGTALAVAAATAATPIIYNLNVEIVQVRDDSGGNPTALTGSNGNSFIYATEVNDIWNQAGIQVTFTTTTWDNTEAQRLTSTERGDIYSDSYTSATGDALPVIPTDALQVFFVMDHPGTGYDGTASSGWVGNPLPNPLTSGRNAGNAQLFIDGTFSSNGRAVMANEGLAVAQLSGTLAHELGHSLGLRHVNDVNAGAAAGTVQDPDYSPLPLTDPNLMWAAGSGPAYDGSLDNDPMLTLLQENFFLLSDQVDAAIHNGLALDPDGNGIGVLQAIPEPGSTSLALLAMLPVLLRRRR